MSVRPIGFHRLPAQPAKRSRFRTTVCLLIRRPVSACSGPRRLDRCASILHTRSQSRSLIGPRFSGSVAGRRSKLFVCVSYSMSERSFFRPKAGLTVAEIASLTRSDLRRAVDVGRLITGIAAIDRASPADLIFLDDAKFAKQPASCSAGACLCSERFDDRIPAHVSLLVESEPYGVF